MRTRELASAGCHRALAAHRQAVPARPVDPDISEAVERQTVAMCELSQRAFPEAELESESIGAARTQRRREADASGTHALRWARAGGAEPWRAPVPAADHGVNLPALAVGNGLIHVDLETLCSESRYNERCAAVSRSKRLVDGHVSHCAFGAVGIRP